MPAQRYHLYATWADGIKIVGRPTEDLKAAQRAADEALERDGASRVVVLGDDGLPHYTREREDGCPPRRRPDLRARISGLAE